MAADIRSEVTGAEAETWFGVIMCHHDNPCAHI